MLNGVTSVGLQTNTPRTNPLVQKARMLHTTWKAGRNSQSAEMDEFVALGEMLKLDIVAVVTNGVITH